MPATAQDVRRFCKLLERRLEAVRSLCQALQESLIAMTNFDFASIEECIARRSELCHVIAVVDGRLARIGKRSEPGAAFALNIVDSEIDSGIFEHLRDVVEDLRKRQQEAAQLSQAVSELARRSCISDTALLNAHLRETTLTLGNPLQRFSNPKGA